MGREIVPIYYDERRHLGAGWLGKFVGLLFLDTHDDVYGHTALWKSHDIVS